MVGRGWRWGRLTFSLGVDQFHVLSKNIRGSSSRLGVFYSRLVTDGCKEASSRCT